MSNLTRRQFVMTVGWASVASSLVRGQSKQKETPEKALETVTLTIDGMT